MISMRPMMPPPGGLVAVVVSLRTAHARRRHVSGDGGLLGVRLHERDVARLTVTRRLAVELLERREGFLNRGKTFPRVLQDFLVLGLLRLTDPGHLGVVCVELGDLGREGLDDLLLVLLLRLEDQRLGAELFVSAMRWSRSEFALPISVSHQPFWVASFCDSVRSRVMSCWISSFTLAKGSAAIFIARRFRSALLSFRAMCLICVTASRRAWFAAAWPAFFTALSCVKTTSVYRSPDE